MYSAILTSWLRGKVNTWDNETINGCQGFGEQRNEWIGGIQGIPSKLTGQLILCNTVIEDTCNYSNDPFVQNYRMYHANSEV